MRLALSFGVALSLLVSGLALANREAKLHVGKLQVTQIRDEGHKATRPIITGQIGSQKVWLMINSPGYVGRGDHDVMVNGWQVFATTDPKKRGSFMGAEELSLRQVRTLTNRVEKYAKSVAKPSQTTKDVLEILKNEDFYSVRPGSNL